VIACAVLLLGRRSRLRPLPYTLAGLTVVPLVFTLLGFNWFEAYRLLVIRYYEGAGGVRPYGYWVWANLACTVLIAGPATVAGLRRAGAAVVRIGVAPVRLRAAPAPEGRSPAPGSTTPAPEESAIPGAETEPGTVACVGARPTVAGAPRLAVLVSAALLALLVADLSGMSKAETERIWLPFVMWMLPAGAFLPRPRAWLIAQATLALLLNHLVLTGW
jgi:hypothetical protein